MKNTRAPVTGASSADWTTSCLHSPMHACNGFSVKVHKQTAFLTNALAKNLGRLWLAYTELQGEFYMLQLISVDSRHFPQS